MRFKRDFLRRPSLEATFFAPLFLKSPGKLLIRDKSSSSPPDFRIKDAAYSAAQTSVGINSRRLESLGLASARKEPTLKRMIDSLAFSMKILFPHNSRMARRKLPARGCPSKGGKCVLHSPKCRALAPRPSRDEAPPPGAAGGKFSPLGPTPAGESFLKGSHEGHQVFFLLLT